MKFEVTASIIESHIRTSFENNKISTEFWKQGPINEILPEFKVLKVEPDNKFSFWAYISVGSWQLFENSKLEFVILALQEDQKHVERLAMTAFYHSLHRLGLNHTFPLGEPWVENSTLEYCLVSRPYPLGIDFEICKIEDAHLHFFWLLPITEKERNFKIEKGVEALEERFEEVELEFWDFERNSVV
jgi:hypothetical protein